MFNSTYLDVAIGLIFVYLLLSLLVTTLNEIVSTWLGLRAKMLRKAIFYLLSDKNGKSMATKVFNHPLINNPADSSITPSYISSKDFSDILIDVITQGKQAIVNVNLLITSINEMENGEIKTMLLSFIKNSDGTVSSVKEKIEIWFDSSMDRITGWYKRKIQLLTFIIGSVICISFHASTFSIVNNLVLNKDSREKLVQMAGDFVQHHSPQVDSLLAHSRANKKALLDTSEKITQGKKDSLKITFVEDSIKAEALAKKIHDLDTFAINQINFLNDEGNIMGIGWNYAIKKIYIPAANSDSCLKNFLFIAVHILLHTIGILIIVLALMLGAPFWFDLLKKLINIRGTGKKPENSASTK